MRRYGPPKILDGSGLSSNSSTSALPTLHLRWASNPICPLRVCASSWRERHSNLVRCLWLAWRFSVGFFGFGLAKYLASVWGMYHCSHGCGSGTPKLVRRAGSQGPYRHGWIVTKSPCLDGLRPKTCEQATNSFLEEVLGWNTSSWNSWVQHLGDTDGGIFCARAAALRVTLATPKCSFSSGGDDGAVSALPCGMQHRSKTLPSWGLFDCLRKPGLVGQPGYLLWIPLNHLEVWAPNMYLAEAEPLPPAAFHPPALLEDLLDPPPPKDLKPLPEGVPPQGQGSQALPPPPPFHRLPSAPGTPGGGEVASLLSIPVTVPGLMWEGGMVRIAPMGYDQPSPSEPMSGPRYPDLSSRDAVGRVRTRGRDWLNTRCSRREAGPLQWWAVLCVYRRARLARRWRWVLQRRGAGLMLAGSVWLGALEWPEPEPRLARRRSAGGSARRSRRRRARRPPAWLTLQGWLPGPEDLFDHPVIP